jgi:hypothetical protein
MEYFGIFYARLVASGHLVYRFNGLVAYFMLSLVYFPPILVYCTKRNLATLGRRDFFVQYVLGIKVVTDGGEKVFATRNDKHGHRFRTFPFLTSCGNDGQVSRSDNIYLMLTEGNPKRY